MGVIRKTMSIGTLGIINFRSKKEKLERAEKAMADVMKERDAEHLARSVAESGFSKVEAELRRLSSAEMKASKQLARLRKRSTQGTRVAMYVADDGERGHRRDRYQST